MRSRFLITLVLLSSAAAQEPGGGQAAVTKVPSGVILVKGAWSSASDSVTPLPEGATIADHVFHSEYFGMTYALPSDWREKYKGPPPSDTGRYVLTELSPAENFKGPAKGTILITAQDMFFAAPHASNAVETIDYMKNNLQGDYKAETSPERIDFAGRSFIYFAYWSPSAQLHWYILATQIRCHIVQITLTSRDTQLLGSLMASVRGMKLPAEAGAGGGNGGGAVPVCMKDYAKGENLITRVDPVFTEHKFNPVPVRIVIDKTGKIKHIHIISAFPDQSLAVTDALSKWQFKPYRNDGQPVEVETGILFGRGNAH